MPEDRTRRRLACAMFADLVGYTRMMEADEAGTLAAFDAIRDGLVRGLLGEHRGRIVKSTGDGFLAEFASVIDAVECGLAMQRAMTTQPTEPHLAFRVGMHLGEIIEGDNDIFGRDVNVAARLQSLCEPGGLCLSSAVYDAVSGKVSAEFEDGGLRSLRNLERPVHVWHWRPEQRSFGLPDDDEAPRPLPTRPSLAVLPFDNMTGDPAQDYFADGLVEEIITEISRHRWLFVIARNSTFTYKGRAVDVRQVSRDLGVRYVLEGSVRKSEDRIRISAQLIDGTTGNHIWAETMSGSLAQVFELQDSIAGGVAGAIEPKLRSAEIDRARRKPTASLDAYDYYLRAQPHLVTGSAGDVATALDFLQKAAAIDRNYALAHAGIAWCRLLQLLGGSEQPTPEFLRAAVAMARRAVELDPYDPEVLSAASIVVCLMGKDYAAGTEWSDISTRLNPNSSMGWGRAGYIKCWVSEFRAGIECFNRAMRLSPFDPMTYVFQSGLGMANMFLGDWPAAIVWLRRSLSNNRHFAPTYRFLAVSLVGSGQLDDARRVIAELIGFDPLSSMRRAQMTGFRDEAPKRLYIDSLRRAGLPE